MDHNKITLRKPYQTLADDAKENNFYRRIGGVQLNQARGRNNQRLKVK